MPSTKKGAAKAAPKKDTRKKPGPHARAKARLAQVQTLNGIPSQSAVDRAVQAAARLDTARAEQLELENIEKREALRRQGVGTGAPVCSDAAGGGPFKLMAASDSGPSPAEPIRVLTVEDAVEAQERCLDYTADLVDRIEKVLEPLLRPQATCGAGGPMPEIIGSNLADKLRTHCGRNAAVNARLLTLLERLDLKA